MTEQPTPTPTPTPTPNEEPKKEYTPRRAVTHQQKQQRHLKNQIE